MLDESDINPQFTKKATALISNMADRDSLDF